METEEAAMEKAKEFSDRYFKSLPPGIRFRPTDEELVGYLKKKVLKERMPLNRIKTCNIYKYHPNDICGPDDVAREKERYFFTTTVKKYPKGGRPDRKAGDGYWKATGKDLPIKCKGEEVGSKMTLVYYEGKPKDISVRKTNWIMHEYRIKRDIIPVAKAQADNNNNNILDECVLAKIYEKTTGSKKPAEPSSSSSQDVSQPILDPKQLPPEDQDNNPILEPEEYPTAPQAAAPPQVAEPDEAAAAAYHGYNTNMMILGSEQLPLQLPYPPEAQDNPILEPEEYPTAPQPAAAAAAPPYPNHQNPMAEAAAAAYHGSNTYIMIPESEQLPLPQLPPPEAQDNPILGPEEYPVAPPQVAELPPFPYQENPMDEAAATFYSWDFGNLGFQSLQTDGNCYGINSGAFGFEEDIGGFWGSLNGGLEDVVGMYMGNNVINPLSAKPHSPANVGDNVNPSAKPHGPADVGDNVNPSATPHGPANVISSHKQKKAKEKNDV